MAPQQSESRDLDKVIVRLPDGMRDRLKAEAEKNGRSMNAEIVERLERSFALPLPELSDDLAGRICTAPSVMRAEVAAEILQLLENRFPEEMPLMPAEQFFDIGMKIFRDVPEEERAKFYVGLIAMCRKLSGNPEWMPPVPDQELPF